MPRQANKTSDDIGYMVRHGMLHIGRKRLQAATGWTTRRAIAARTELLRLVAQEEKQDVADLAQSESTVPVVSAPDEAKSITASKMHADRVLSSLMP